ncbi:hypothetical protein KCU65_g6516, partial [Aureobasidium melanogenum]
MEYLAEMFKACAAGEDPKAVQGHWEWFVEDVMSVGDSLVQARLMEAPAALPKIKKLINKTQPKKPKGRNTRKRTLELPSDDEPGDEDYDDVPEGDEDEDEDADDQEEKSDDQEEPKKPKRGCSGQAGEGQWAGEAIKGLQKDIVESKKAIEDLRKQQQVVGTSTAVSYKKCVLELATAWSVTPSGKHDQWCINLASYLRMLGDDPCSASSTALQTMLVELFSVDANADLMTSAQLNNMPTKQQDASVFKMLGDAVKRLIITEANTVLVEVGSLALFANTGELLAHHIALLRDRSELLRPLYANAYSQNHGLYGKQDTTGSYRQFIISTTISDTYGTEAAQARPLVEQKLRIAEVVYWFNLAFGNGALALLVQSQWKKKPETSAFLPSSTTSPLPSRRWAKGSEASSLQVREVQREADWQSLALRAPLPTRLSRGVFLVVTVAFQLGQEQQIVIIESVIDFGGGFAGLLTLGPAPR